MKPPTNETVGFSAHLLLRVQFLFRKKNTQVDARNQAFPFGQPPFFQNEACWLVFFFSLRFLFLRIVAYVHDRVSFHTFPLGSIDLLSIVRSIHCFFSFALTLVAVSSEAGFSNCLSRKRKCFSRFVSSMHRTTICFKSGVVSRFTFLNSILNVQRQQM